MPDQRLSHSGLALAATISDVSADYGTGTSCTFLSFLRVPSQLIQLRAIHHNLLPRAYELIL